MRAYSNKSIRVDDRALLFSEIEKGKKARKVANRREAKKEIQELLREEEQIQEELNEQLMEEELYYWSYEEFL